MDRRIFLCIAWIAYLLGGCAVSTPTYHLPLGYSESYRRILQQRQELAPLPTQTAINADDVMTLPALPLEPPAAPGVEADLLEVEIPEVEAESAENED